MNTNITGHPTLRTKDWYLAAYLHIYDVPLIAVHPAENGKVEFEFANDRDWAHSLLIDFRANDGRDLVSINAFRAAYRYIQSAAQHERDIRSYDNYCLNNN